MERWQWLWDGIVSLWKQRRVATKSRKIKAVDTKLASLPIIFIFTHTSRLNPKGHRKLASPPREQVRT
jgi:hypothetical protein